jgi:hypothetical protein
VAVVVVSHHNSSMEDLLSRVCTLRSCSQDDAFQALFVAFAPMLALVACGAGLFGDDFWY